MYRGVEQLVARRAHNPEVGGSSPPPATQKGETKMFLLFSYRGLSPDYFYIPPKSPFGKGGLLGWGFPTTPQKGQQLQNLSKTS